MNVYEYEDALNRKVNFNSEGKVVSPQFAGLQFTDSSYNNQIRVVNKYYTPIYIDKVFNELVEQIKAVFSQDVDCPNEDVMIPEAMECLSDCLLRKMPKVDSEVTMEHIKGVKNGHYQIKIYLDTYCFSVIKAHYSFV